MKKMTKSRLLIYIVAGVFALMCLIPFLLVLGGSFTDEQEIRGEGYKLIPKQFSLKAYQLLFIEPRFVMNAYGISIIVTLAGTAFGLMFSAMLAYPISLKRFRLRRVMSLYVILTLLFNGGMVSWYIITVNFLRLKNNIFALIIPMLVNGFNVMLIRNYFETIPDEMHESAKIDGAGDILTFFRIIVPLSTPVLATVSLFIALGYWNDWWLGIMLIDNSDLQPLQILLRSIVSNINFLKNSEEGARMIDPNRLIPAEGVKLATCIVTIGPIIFAYPFVQRYFVKGIMLGAVKN